ncbi:hypothetical protein [Vibrio alfacsensis]|uniref:hypothetical protein n=1 Tax=Vibrio alfacsensis TaxID=1074311 RepID=UPI001BEF6A55|nr:hypothetical protein [Vibrio alfacsensis]WQE78665.1 hypothetical protein SO574_16085 [Vibrio alfacsensis]BBM67164.1 hypothetical protein VA249_38100 [Vibrio alfacsensis]BCN26523.1 hypothetical protein VYA_37150 [Vibrio alfacsensis]
MTRTTSAVLILILISAYFSYNHFYVYPHKLETQAESMLIQMANREEWLNVPEMMVLVEAHKAHLELNADIKSTDGQRAYSEGYITFSNRGRNVCKEVIFNFQINSLRNYRISDLHDCSLGEYY